MRLPDSIFADFYGSIYLQLTLRNFMFMGPPPLIDFRALVSPLLPVRTPRFIGHGLSLQEMAGLLI
jgi:hypothetical protein